MNFNKEKVMSGSGPIHKHDISDTVKVIAGLVEVYPEELMDGLLGSAGKQEVSGDIDLAVEDTLENIVDVLERNNATFKVNKGLNCVHLLVEIKGPKRDIPNYTGTVQVDLFFGEKEWLKFSHFSAGDKSRYKGLDRTILLQSIISATTDFADHDDDGNLIAKVGPIFNLSEGIRTQYRIAPAKKNGEGYIKKLIEVDADDNIFNNRYGFIRTQHIDINTPSEAAIFIFGRKASKIYGGGEYNDITEQDLGSFEQVHKLMLERIPAKKQQIIQKIFRNRTGKVLPIKESTMPWHENITIGWWLNNESITFYHGTHKDKAELILQNGLKASQTGKTAGIAYLALEPFTGRGYGAMSGETEFRAAGHKAKHVPLEDRATIVFSFPKSYVLESMNWDNPKLINKTSYDKFVGSDNEYYELAEVTHPGDISPEFIIGYM